MPATYCYSNGESCTPLILPRRCLDLFISTVSRFCMRRGAIDFISVAAGKGNEGPWPCACITSDQAQP